VKTEVALANSTGTAMNCCVVPDFDFSPVADWLALCTKLLAQQLCSQPLLDICGAIPQSEAIWLMGAEVVAIAQPGAQAPFAVVPSAQGNAASAGCTASRTTTNRATNWRSRFMNLRMSMADCEARVCEMRHKPETGKIGLGSVSRESRPIYFAVNALSGTSMSSLRMTRLVALRVASSKPWPWVMASVGQASTQ
jgi:hypothetical protein